MDRLNSARLGSPWTLWIQFSISFEVSYRVAQGLVDGSRWRISGSAAVGFVAFIYIFCRFRSAWWFATAGKSTLRRMCAGQPSGGEDVFFWRFPNGWGSKSSIYRWIFHDFPWNKPLNLGTHPFMESPIWKHRAHTETNSSHRVFDKDGSGTISRDELAQADEDMMPGAPAPDGTSRWM